MLPLRCFHQATRRRGAALCRLVACSPRRVRRRAGSRRLLCSKHHATNDTPPAVGSNRCATERPLRVFCLPNERCLSFVATLSALRRLLSCRASEGIINSVLGWWHCSSSSSNPKKA